MIAHFQPNTCSCEWFFNALIIHNSNVFIIYKSEKMRGLHSFRHCMWYKLKYLWPLEVYFSLKAIPLPLWLRENQFTFKLFPLWILTQAQRTLEGPKCGADGHVLTQHLNVMEMGLRGTMIKLMVWRNEVRFQKCFYQDCTLKDSELFLQMLTEAMFLFLKPQHFIF